MRPERFLGVDPTPGDLAETDAVMGALREVVRMLVESRGRVDAQLSVDGVWSGPIAAPLSDALGALSRRLLVYEDAAADLARAVDEWRAGLAARSDRTLELVEQMSRLAGEDDADTARATLRASVDELVPRPRGRRRRAAAPGRRGRGHARRSRRARPRRRPRPGRCGADRGGGRLGAAAGRRDGRHRHLAGGGRGADPGRHRAARGDRARPGADRDGGRRRDGQQRSGSAPAARRAEPGLDRRGADLAADRHLRGGGWQRRRRPRRPGAGPHGRTRRRVRRPGADA